MTHAPLIRMVLAALLVIRVYLLEAMMLRVPAHLMSDLLETISETIMIALKVHGAKMANQKITANMKSFA